MWIAISLLCCLPATAQQPVSVGIVFDTSGSMGANVDRSRELVSALLTAAGSQDEFSLVEFNDRAKVARAFTTDRESIQDRLGEMQPKGRSAMWDGILLGLNEMKKSHYPRRALVVTTDGGNNSSRYTESEVRSLAREAGTPIYFVAIEHAADALSGVADKVDDAAAVLARLKSDTLQK